MPVRTGWTGTTVTKVTHSQVIVLKKREISLEDALNNNIIHMQKSEQFHHEGILCAYHKIVQQHMVISLKSIWLYLSFFRSGKTTKKCL